MDRIACYPPALTLNADVGFAGESCRSCASLERHELLATCQQRMPHRGTFVSFQIDMLNDWGRQYRTISFDRGSAKNPKLRTRPQNLLGRATPRLQRIALQHWDIV